MFNYLSIECFVFVHLVNLLLKSVKHIKPIAIFTHLSPVLLLHHSHKKSIKIFKMKTVLPGLFLMASCAIAYTARAQDVSTAKWATQPITIDGAATEWHQPLNFYDSETKLLFAISNDSANIYLCFEAKDNMTQMKIMRGGMRVELDTKGRNGKSASINFPLPPKEREEMGEGDNNRQPASADTSI